MSGESMVAVRGGDDAFFRLDGSDMEAVVLR